MGLKINSGTSQYEIAKVEFDPPSNSFQCFDSSLPDPVFTYPLPFLYSGDAPKFSERICFFTNDIFGGHKLLSIKFRESVRRDEMAGFVFPLSSFNDDPTIFGDEHMRKMAFNVIYRLLQAKNVTIAPKDAEYRPGSDYTLTDFYNEDLILVVIVEQWVPEATYPIEDFLPSLFTYGFRYAPRMNFEATPTTCNTIISKFTSVQASIRLSIPSNSLHKNFFLSGLLKNNLFNFENEIARFHLYYQVIEFLMEKVFKNELQRGIVDNFAGMSAFDIKDYLRESMPETYSIQKLLGGNYSDLATEIVEELKDSIANFFSYIGDAKIADSLPSRIYKMRNFLFHGYSRVLEDNAIDHGKVRTYLNEINGCFECLIVDLIASYSFRTQATVI